jgi:hypothetical protein
MRFWSIKLVVVVACLLLVLLALNILTVSDPFLATMLAAFLLFILPGFLLSYLIWGWHHPLLDQLALAFGLSVGLWIIPAALLLWLHGNLAMMIGAVLIITLLLAGAALFRSQPNQPIQAGLESADASVTTGDQAATSCEWPRLIYWMAFVTSLALLLLIFTNMAFPFRGDRLSSQAFIRHFLDSEQFLTKGFRISSTYIRVTVRDLTHTWALLLALVIKVAEVDLLDAYVYYLPSLLILVSYLALYALAKELFNSQISALTACLVQIVYCLSDIPVHEGIGRSLFLRIMEDKFLLRFVLLPVALWLTLRYLRKRNKGDLVSLIIAIVALGLVHPTGLALYGISFGNLLLVTLLFGSWSEKKEKLSRIIPIVSIVLFVMLIPLWQRQQMVSSEFGVQYFEVERGVRFNERLLICSHKVDQYIASPNLIAHPLIILAILLTPLLLRYLRTHLSARFLFANMTGVLILCYTPVITPLLGKVIAPGMIWRVLWLLPVSLVISFFLGEATRELTNRFGQISFLWLQLVPLGVILVGALLFRGKIDNGIDYLEEMQNSRALTAEERALFTYLRENGTPGSVIMTPNPQLSNEIPSS